MQRASRADYVRRLQESVRRYTKVRTYFGLQAVPIGTTSMVVLPLNRKKDKYLLLSAQSNALQNKVDYEEVQQVAEVIHRIYNEGKCGRAAWYKFITLFSYFMVVMSFLFLLAIFLTLTQTTGLPNLYIFIGYVFCFTLLWILYVYGYMYMT